MFSSVGRRTLFTARHGSWLGQCGRRDYNSIRSVSAQAANCDKNTCIEEYDIDARKKLLSKYTNPKVKITEKDIESRIVYNSLVDSFRDPSPLMQRLKKYSKFDSAARDKKHQELLSKEVDSVVASVLEKSNTQTETCDISNLLQNEKVKEEQVVFPYASFTPIDQKVENWKRLQRLRKRQSISEDDVDYGTPNPNVPVSQVPCGGCGALLHCQNPSIPGYLPSEIFKTCDRHDLRGHICQRCRFLREHDVALKVSISPEDYPKVISAIQDKYAMVVLVVDLLDFPCSIWPGLLDIIGKKRPVIVVGNKIDLIPQDSRGYLDHVKKCLVNELEKSGLSRANVKHVSLVSATTGYGVEELITKIQHVWAMKGDVYLLGCTNVGKSSLFNALINSDFCKVQAIDILERATVSAWPGTTLNLLKFPIMRPTSLRLRQRLLRLKADRASLAAEEKMRLEKLKETGDRKYASLIGYIGRTFFIKKEGRIESSDPFAVRANKASGEDANYFNPEHEDFVASKWCLDTPGTVNQDQILTMLSLEELMTVLPKKLIKPRTILLLPGSSYFLAGLARIDFINGAHPLLLTTFASGRLPLTVVKQEDADQMYRELLGSPLLAVPCGGEGRLKQWPGLASKDVTVEGVGSDESAIDIVLSSAGWVAVSGEKGATFQLKVFTPEARGIHIRNPSLLPHAVKLRGKRVGKSPTFENNRIFMR